VIDWEELADLPGATLVRRGLEARARGEVSVEALLVSIASARLRRAGFSVPVDDLPEDRDMALYRAVGAAYAGRPDVDAYGRYNSLRRELDSFLAAVDHRARRLTPNH
jgi:hypothetical protein